MFVDVLVCCVVTLSFVVCYGVVMRCFSVGVLLAGCVGVWVVLIVLLCRCVVVLLI